MSRILCWIDQVGTKSGHENLSFQARKLEQAGKERRPLASNSDIEAFVRALPILILAWNEYAGLRMCWATDAFLDQISRQFTTLSSVVEEHDFRTQRQEKAHLRFARPEAMKKTKSATIEGQGTAMSDYANMLESISALAGSLGAINQQAVREYTPVVETILHSRSPDARSIERTLDGLLDFCGYEPALQLYEKLCRYYFPINPAVTADYIYAYREMWDSEEKEDQP